MPQSYNRIELIGRIGRDPDLRQTADGQAFARFTLATDRPSRNGAEAETDWHEIVCWAQQAEFAAHYLTKGRLVFVAGRLAYRSWTGRDGQQRHGVSIHASHLLPLDRRPDAAPGEAAPGEQPPDLYGPDVPF